MFRHRFTSKLTAIFVTAFICLNAGGALCVAYCQTFDIAAEAEHCPLKKAAEHCDKTIGPDGDSDTMASPTGEMDCCPMTVSFFAAPVESNSVSFASVIAAPVQEFSFTPALIAGRQRFLLSTPYRGPPRDRRVDRLKYCIIRI